MSILQVRNRNNYVYVKHLHYAFFRIIPNSFLAVSGARDRVLLKVYKITLAIANDLNCILIK